MLLLDCWDRACVFVEAVVADAEEGRGRSDDAPELDIVLTIMRISK